MAPGRVVASDLAWVGRAAHSGQVGVGRRHLLIVAVLALLPTLGCGPSAPQPGPQSPTAGEGGPVALPPVDCGRSVRHDAIPEWARSGFRDDGSSYRHVEGYRGEVVGVLFGYPLSVPRRADRSNKILWVPRLPPGPGRLSVDAQLEGRGTAVHRDVGFGGGQSIIDLPSPGCWRMTLRWGADVSDTVDVPYVPRRP